MDKVVVKREDYDGPPVLTREIYDGGDEEDNFVEMEETDEEEEISLHQPIQRTSSFDGHHESQEQTFEAQQSEEVLELDETFTLRAAKPAPKYPFDHSKYIVEFRESQHKSKNKNSHKVAIVVKIDENMCHEFNFNRASEYDGTKYYTCLGCRKAKFDTKIKDVVRTIRIEERYRQILSKGDPFLGHHCACEPLPWAPDARSYGHVLPQPMHMDLGEYAPSELVYVDADGTEGIWEPAEASGLLNLATIPFYGEEGPPPPPAKVKNEVIEEELQSTESTSSVGIQYKNNISFYKRFMKKRRMMKQRKPHCHLCFAVLSSTEALITHLQRHLEKKKHKRIRMSKDFNAHRANM